VSASTTAACYDRRYARTDGSTASPRPADPHLGRDRDTDSRFEVRSKRLERRDAFVGLAERSLVVVELSDGLDCRADPLDEGVDLIAVPVVLLYR
jgi:hypothetical protein